MIAASGPTVLLVEDDVDVCDALAEALEDRGYRVLRATDGCAALAALHGSGPRPAIILLDLMMPVMDGMEFRAIQRADPTIAGIPVVLISADPATEAVAQRLDVAAWLRKPVTLDRLLTSVARVCEPQLVAS